MTPRSGDEVAFCLASYSSQTHTARVTEVWDDGRTVDLDVDGIPAFGVRLWRQGDESYWTWRPLDEVAADEEAAIAAAFAAMGFAL